MTTGSGSSLTGTISLSYTDYISVGTEMAALASSSVVIDEVNRFVSAREIISVPTGSEKWSILSRDGSRLVSLHKSDSDEVLWQRGQKIENDVPQFLKPIFFGGMRHDLSSPDVLIASKDTPIMDWSDINALVGDGRASIEGQEWLLGFLSSRVVYTDGVSTHNVWFDDTYGIRLRHERLRNGIVVADLIAERATISDVTGIDYSPGLYSNIPTEYFETKSFNPSVESPSTPGVSGLLYPVYTPISGSVEVAVSTYITGTSELDKNEIEANGGLDFGWVIAQELSDGSGVEAVVLQGDDREDLVGTDVLRLYWPPSWGSSDPLTWSSGEYSGHYTTQFTDTTAVDVYSTTLVADLPHGVMPLDFAYIVTWVEPVHNRVVFAINGVSSINSAFGWAEAYRNSSE